MKLHTVSAGHGPSVVFLHGWGLNHAVWPDIAGQLQQDYRVHMVDLPGHGQSPAFQHYSLDSMCDVLKSQFTEPCTVVAWSMGGLLAMRWAMQAETVYKLFLVTSTPQFYPSEDWPHAMARDDLADFERRLEQDYQQTLGRFLALQTLGTDTAKSQIRRLRQAVIDAGAPQPQALKGFLQILLETNLRPELQRVHCPVFLLQGSHDKLVPAQCTAPFAGSLPRANYVIMDGAAHAPFLSHPDTFVRYLKAFLTKPSL